MVANIQLFDGEEIIFHTQPNIRSIIPKIGYLFFILLITVFILIFRDEASTKVLNATSPMMIAHICAVSMSFFTVILLLCLWKSIEIRRTHYYLTNKRCIITSGIMTSSRRVIMYQHIVDTGLTQSVLHKLVHLVSVCIDDNTKQRILLFGLTPQDGDKIVDMVSKHIHVK